MPGVDVSHQIRLRINDKRSRRAGLVIEQVDDLAPMGLVKLIEARRRDRARQLAQYADCVDTSHSRGYSTVNCILAGGQP